MDNPALIPASPPQQEGAKFIDTQGKDTSAPTLMEEAKSTIGSAVNTAVSSDIYYGLRENLENSPVRYNNAVDYVQKSAQALADPQNYKPDNKLLSPEEANQTYWQPGMPKFSTPIYEQAAQTISQRQSDQNQRDQTIAKANMGFAGNAGLGLAQSALQLLDPIQDAMFFVPVAGEEQAYARVAKGLSKGLIGKTAATAFRVGGEITRGSLEQNLTDITLNTPLGQEKGLEDYAKEDALNVVSAASIVLGIKGIAKTFSKGSEIFSKLDPATQEHLTNSLSSESPAPINSVLDLDKNVCEMEAQLGGGKGTIEDRSKLLTEEDAPNTSQQIKEAVASNKVAPAVYLGEQETGVGKPSMALYNLTEDILGHPAGSTVSEATLIAKGLVPPDKAPSDLLNRANDIAQQGKDIQDQRAQQVKNDSDAGLLQPKPNPILPEPTSFIEPGADIKAQSEAVNKLLTDTQQAHADLIKTLQEDPEKNSNEIDNLNKGMESADEEITRVSAQKNFVQTAVGCAINNGL